MADIDALIRSAVRSAREINRMFVDELRIVRGLEREAQRLDQIMSIDGLRALQHHSDAVWQLQAGRDECMQLARGLRRMASYLPSGGAA